MSLRLCSCRTAKLLLRTARAAQKAPVAQTTQNLQFHFRFSKITRQRWVLPCSPESRPPPATNRELKAAPQPPTAHPTPWTRVTQRSPQALPPLAALSGCPSTLLGLEAPEHAGAATEGLGCGMGGKEESKDAKPMEFERDRQNRNESREHRALRTRTDLTDTRVSLPIVLGPGMQAGSGPPTPSPRCTSERIFRVRSQGAGCTGSLGGPAPRVSQGG